MTTAGSFPSWSLVIPHHLFRDTKEAPSIRPSVFQLCLVSDEGMVLCVCALCVWGHSGGRRKLLTLLLLHGPGPQPLLARGSPGTPAISSCFRGLNGFALKLLPRPLLSFSSHGHPAPGSLPRQVSP